MLIKKEKDIFFNLFFHNSQMNRQQQQLPFSRRAPGSTISATLWPKLFFLKERSNSIQSIFCIRETETTLNCWTSKLLFLSAPGTHQSYRSSSSCTLCFYNSVKERERMVIFMEMSPRLSATLHLT